MPLEELVIDSAGLEFAPLGIPVRFTRPVRVLQLNGGRRLYFPELDWTSGILPPEPRPSLRCMALTVLSAEILRLFLIAREGFGADNSTPAEKQRWLAALKLFDYCLFRAAFNSPIFESGRLVGITRKGIRILFDSEEEPEFVAYDLFPPGDASAIPRRGAYIGAFVTRGAEGEITRIEKLVKTLIHFPRVPKAASGASE